MKRLVSITTVASLGLAGCCFGGAGGFNVSGPTTSIGPGFAPDPMVLTGAAGGPSDASTMAPSCRGFVGIIPSHTLDVAAAMPMLRVMAASEVDTTLVVRLPDGTYVCNDDADGFNPVVELPGAGPGQYNVYVGTYSQGNSGTYQLGITTNPGVMPSQLQSGALPPPPVGDAPLGQVLRRGQATVALVTGNVPGVQAGSTCEYVQTASDPSQTGFDCRWQVTCGGVVVYGDGDGGFNPCADPSWPPGTLVADLDTSGTDQDPSLVINAGGMMVRDDAAGPRGAYQITATPSQLPRPPG
jgi:hypothetical protein